MPGLRTTFAFVAVALTVVPLIISAPLLDPDEGLHAAIAQEMLLQREYVTPTFLGEPFLDKPILFFWVEAFSLRAFGMNEAAVRLPPLLFGALGMLSLALLGAAMFGLNAGLIGGIVYGTMLLPVAISNVAVHDIALVPFMCGAAWCVWRASGSRRAWAWGVPAGVCLGFSILTKGLAGAVFVGIFAMCVAVRQPSAIARLAIALTIAGGVASCVAAPWYLAMERAHPGYLHYYFIERHLRGYLTATQRHAGRPWWYYLPIVLGGALPWTGYLAGALRHVRGTGQRPLIWIAWAWFGLGLLFLSIGESKLVTYALPIFPALALAIGDEIMTFGRSRVGLAIQIATLAVLPIATVIALRFMLDASIGLTWIIAMAAMGVVLLLARRAVGATTIEAGIGAGALMALVSYIAVMSTSLPHAAAYLTARDLASALNAGPHLPSRVAILDERIGSIIFYLSPALRAEATPDRIQTTSLPSAIDHVRVDPPDAVLAVRDEQLRRFTRLFPQTPQPSIRAGTFTLYRADHLRNALETNRR
jgi:4-amino-4-deoxy-L-arabinose transferase-like glycosyltransferase